MISEKIVYIGVLINLICAIWYIRSIFKGNTRPNLISFFLWSLAPAVGVFLQVKAGASASIWGTAMAGFGPLLILVVSLFNNKYIWKLNYFDFVCGLFSIVALIIYIITNNLGFSIIFAILSDLLAGIPTVLKSWKFPESEFSSIYIAGIIGNILSLLVIKDWSFSIYSFSIYLLGIDIAIIFSIYHRKLFSVFRKPAISET